MPLLGKGAVAMWWTVPNEHVAEFGDWHSHEHFPERLGIPGFLRGSRWASQPYDGSYFVLYELEAYEVLTSRSYLDRLNDPTPWSTKMMPFHHGMVRSQCRVLASHGGGIAGAVTTMRLSPGVGAAAELQQWLATMLATLPDQPGLSGAHLLRTETPVTQVPTTEQKIRGRDGAADWIVILSGYDPAAVNAAVEDRLGFGTLQAHGVTQRPTVNAFQLSFALTAVDAALKTV